jgi:hypothetical protein
MPVSLIASKKLMYGLRGYAAGEPFEARDESDATVLVHLKMASRVDAPRAKVIEPEPVEVQIEETAPEPEPVEDTPAPEAEPEPEAPVDAEPRKRRTYRRRDMAADTE